MKITYVGLFSAVTVPLPYGGEVTAKHGEAVDLPDSLAVRLLEQKTNWQPAGTAAIKEGGAK